MPKVSPTTDSFLGELSLVQCIVDHHAPRYLRTLATSVATLVHKRYEFHPREHGNRISTASSMVTGVNEGCKIVENLL